MELRILRADDQSDRFFFCSVETLGLFFFFFSETHATVEIPPTIFMRLPAQDALSHTRMRFLRQIENSQPEEQTLGLGLQTTKRCKTRKVTFGTGFWLDRFNTAVPTWRGEETLGISPGKIQIRIRPEKRYTMCLFRSTLL